MDYRRFIGQVVYIDSGSYKRPFYGCVVDVNGDKLHVVEYTRTVEFSLFHNTQRALAEINDVIIDLQSELKMLRTEYDFCVASKDYTILKHNVLQLSKKRLWEIEEIEWHSIIDPNTLHDSSKLICGLVIAILQDSDFFINWKPLQYAVLDGSLVKILSSLDNIPIKKTTFKQVSLKYAETPLFFDNCAEEFRVVSFLKKWVGAFLDYQRVKFFFDDRSEIAKRVHTCVRNIEVASRRRHQIKTELQLLLTGHVLQRGDTVYILPVTDCLRVLGLSPEIQFFSGGHLDVSNAETCSVSNQNDQFFKNGVGVLHKQPVLYHEKPNGTKLYSDIFLYINLCEELQKELLQCSNQTFFLQKKLCCISVERITSNIDVELECSGLKAEIRLLKNNNWMLLQKILNAKKTIINGYLRKCKQ